MNIAHGRRHPNHTAELFQLRPICTCFPDAEEIDEDGVGEPVYKVDGRIFAMQHRIDDRMSVWCKAAPGIQEVLVAENPGRFFEPPYVGHRGWIGIWLDGTPDWEEIKALIEDSYRRTAPEGRVAGTTAGGVTIAGLHCGNQVECLL